MNIIKDKRIAIVGGGPGGLTLARLLQLKGAGVKVYERDINKDVRVQGATLDLHEESGLKALREAGLTDAFKENYRPGADLMRIIDKDANILFDEHETPISDKTFDEAVFRPEIDRGPLRKILLDSLMPGTVIWDSHFICMKKINDSWRLEFKNGTTATADIVIAADGANSKIRSYITSVVPFYTGFTAIEGTVYDAATNAPMISRLLKGGKIFAMGASKTLIVSAKGDGSLQFYTGFKANESWVQESGLDFTNNKQIAAWFQKEYGEWNNTWLELFENAEPAFIPRPLYCMPLDQYWDAQPDITILGDAAHLMPPYAGEGVNMAMQDALELSNCLTDDAFDDTRTAIAFYEEKMRARASEIAKETLEQTESLHSEDAIQNMLNMFSYKAVD
ncbi:MAG TPA: NAD(P)/FAD-dependent oxidoreductase [Parafilimonas sp.]|nr:NAD(P)/FAD-dependent oxidoreductase [Parafilimonas sp.]